MCVPRYETKNRGHRIRPVGIAHRRDPPGHELTDAGRVLLPATSD